MRRAFLVLCIALFSGGLSAQAEREANEVRENFNNYSLDLSVPESPAFALLGVTPQDVIYPTSLRQFSASLVSGISSGGDIQQGIALEAAPYLLVAGKDITLTDYQNRMLLRRLLNTQVSLATAKVADDPSGKGTKAALGVHMRIYDNGDPRFDAELANCYYNNSKAVFSAAAINPFDPAEQPVTLAFDVYRAAGGSYLLRVLVMASVTVAFLRTIASMHARLMAADGQTGLRIRARGLWRCWGPRGYFSALLPAYLRYFKPNFHPWDQDDDALIARFSTELGYAP